MPPTLRWVRCVATVIALSYVNLCLSNMVSLRQRWYVFGPLNQTQWTPLYDTLFFDWFYGKRVPLPVEMTLRDMVDVCTYGWVLMTLLVWCVAGRPPIVLAKVLTAQVLLIPTFSLAQLLTIVPDATPNCLTTYEIPDSPDTRWVFYRWPSRTCGNMLWSSDTAQLVMWTSVALELVSRKKKKCRWMVFTLGECWLLMTMAFIFSSRYQYSVDVISTVLVVKLLMTHPVLTKTARAWFVKDAAYFERVPVQEIPPYRI